MRLFNRLKRSHIDSRCLWDVPQIFLIVVLFFSQLVAQGQFTILKQPLGFIKALQWVSDLMEIMARFVGLVLMEVQIVENLGFESWAAKSVPNDVIIVQYLF